MRLPETLIVIGAVIGIAIIALGNIEPRGQDLKLNLTHDKARVTVEHRADGRINLALWINGSDWQRRLDAGLGESWEMVAQVQLTNDQAAMVARSLGPMGTQ